MLHTDWCLHLGPGSPWRRTRPYRRHHQVHLAACSPGRFSAFVFPPQTAPTSSAAFQSTTPSPSTYTSPISSHSASPPSSSSTAPSFPSTAVTPSTSAYTDSTSLLFVSRFTTSSLRTTSRFIIVSIKRPYRRMRGANGWRGRRWLRGGVDDCYWGK